MHATTQNVFGVHTEYGTHPKQPHRRTTRVRTIAKKATNVVVVGALATWYFLR